MTTPAGAPSDAAPATPHAAAPSSARAAAPVTTHDAAPATPHDAAPGTRPTTPAPGAVVEAASWPPVESVVVGGWRVGLSGGLTRRANSVLPLAEPDDVDAALAGAEALYAARGLPSVVRVCRAARPGDLDERLAARGYRVAATTLVLVADLDRLPAPGRPAPADGSPATPAAHVLASDRPDDGWVRRWAGVKTGGARPTDPAAAAARVRHAQRLLTGAPAAYLAGWLPGPDGPGASADEEPDAVVRVALTHGDVAVPVRGGRTATPSADGASPAPSAPPSADVADPAPRWAAVSCLAVADHARRRGLGRTLTLAALAVARDAGAERAFLQVEAANAGAVDLYTRLGFVVGDRYHYRQRG